MEALTYKETAFLMNISDDAAINIFIRYLKPNQVENMRRSDIVYKKKDRKELLKELRESLKGERLEVSTLTKYFNINVHLLISSINDRFFKSKECLDYLEQYFRKKWVQDKKTGFYPLTMTAPPECVAFMNEESKNKLRKWFKGRFMSGPENARIECILKIK